MRRTGGQRIDTRPYSGPAWNGRQVEASRGGEWLRTCWKMGGTKKEAPTGVARDVSHVDGVGSGRMDRGRGGRSNMQSGAAGVKRDLGRRSKAAIQQAHEYALESGGSGCLSR